MVGRLQRVLHRRGQLRPRVLVFFLERTGQVAVPPDLDRRLKACLIATVLLIVRLSSRVNKSFQDFSEYEVGSDAMLAMPFRNTRTQMITRPTSDASFLLFPLTCIIRQSVKPFIASLMVVSANRPSLHGSLLHIVILVYFSLCCLAFNS